MPKRKLLGLALFGLIAVGGGCHSTDSSDKSTMEKPDNDEKQEVSVPIDQIPAPVVATVKQEVPDGTITEASTEQKDGKTVYEMDVKSASVAYELKTAADGTFISKKVDDDKD